MLFKDEIDNEVFINPKNIAVAYCSNKTIRIITAGDTRETSIKFSTWQDASEVMDFLSKSQSA